MAFAVSADPALHVTSFQRFAAGKATPPQSLTVPKSWAGALPAECCLVSKRRLTSSSPTLPVPSCRKPSPCRATTTEQVAVLPSDPESLQLIEQVRGILDREHPDLPLGLYGRDDEAMIWWFLRDRKMDVAETVAKLHKAIKWRYDFGVANLTFDDVTAEAATGKAYLHEHPDLGGRPVIVVAAAKHFPNADRLVASEQLCVFLIEQALAQLPPGEERFLGIFDLRGFTARNADLAFVGFLVQVFFNYYPKRLHRVLFVDAPPIFQPGWRMMKPMLKSYASLVEFCSAEDVQKQYFEPSKAPPSFL